MTDEIMPPANTPPDLATPSRDTSQAAMPAAMPAALRGLLAAVAILVLVVVVGGVLLWRQVRGPSDQVAALQAQLAALQGRLDKVEARPLPPPPTPAPDLHPLEQRLAAMEQKSAATEQRLSVEEHKPPPVATLDAAAQQQIAAVSSRIDGVAARQNQLGTTEQTDVAKLNDQVAELNRQMAVVTKSGTAIATLAEREARTARLQMANVALQSGKPLGAIPNAPPALAQFADKPPPTDAALRLSFEAAADAAHVAGQPAKETTSLWARMLDKAQSGVTIREGDRVIVGDAVSGVLARSRHLLNAGDLPGAVAALDGLAGPAAAAMAPWRGRAQSLLDARAALIAAANS